MSDHHEQLVQAASDAINAVFGDKSVSPNKTLESMHELKEVIDMNIIEALSAALDVIHGDSKVEGERL